MSAEHSALDTEQLDPQVERTPTVLLLDTSSSMKSKTQTPDGEWKPKVDQVNEGLELFHDEVLDINHARERVDLAVVSFGGDVTVEQEFTTIENWTPSKLSAGGRTPMGKAIERGIELVEERKSALGDDAIQYSRPLLWLLTDGQPTDMSEGDQLWARVQKQLDVGTEENRFLFFAMGVGDADINTLNELVSETGRPALKIKEGMFKEYFRFVSNSIGKASHPNSGDSFQLDTEHLKDFAQIG
jgi:uncharacterized protein YegL